MVSIANLDLNLLVSLDALLTERSVTKAAARLGLSQPALSAALARLRRHFGDDLLARVGNNYELTPLAVALKPRTAVAITSIGRVFTTQATFEPGESSRIFSLLASDYAIAVAGGVIGRVVAETAPGVRIEIRQFSTSDIDQVSETLRRVDALIFPQGFIDNVPHQDLFTDGWVCLVATDNERVGEALTLDDIANLPWVFTHDEPSAFTPTTRQLQLMGLEPRVRMVVGSFLALPSIISGTDQIALVQSRLAPRLTAAGDVRALPCPFEPLPLTESLWWQESLTHDPGHRWLREVCAEAGRRISPAGAASSAVAMG